ncbi:MAG TPA: SgcJ/EcaC family oxidoreductase [Terriglobales bacterium]|nr:SgcJ/EcaC family oxidoreductase [Terriglobales bacterium]
MATTLSTPFPSKINAKAQIEEILTELPECWNRHDIAGYISHFTEDVNFVNVLGGHNRGRAAVETELIAIHQTIFRNSRLKVVGHSIRFLAPEVAVVHIDWEMTGHENPLEKQWQGVREGIITAVFVVEGDAWRITAFHNTDKVAVPVR